MNKIAHYYNPETLLYTHSIEVKITAGYNAPLKPQCASFSNLPDYDPNLQILKIDIEKDEWQVVSQKKKVTAYHKQTQQTKQFDDKSLVTDDYTLNEPLPHSIWQDNDWVQQVDLLQVAKRNEINQWRDAQEASPKEIVTVNGTDWDANPSARSRIESTLSSDYLPPFWTDANDVDQPITLDVLKAVHTAIVQRGFEIHARQREMKAEIEQITDFEALEAYKVGWPE